MSVFQRWISKEDGKTYLEICRGKLHQIQPREAKTDVVVLFTDLSDDNIFMFQDEFERNFEKIQESANLEDFLKGG